MKPKVPPTGELRRSQILTTFGPGAMVDLPNHAVLIGGLEFWKGDKERIYEDRLETYLKDRLKAPELKLFAPPVDGADPSAPRTGIDVFEFPTWFLAQVDETWTAPDGRVYRTRPLLPWDRRIKGGYLDRDRKHKPVVPIRFVQACVKGHISDIDWYRFVRGSSSDRTGELWLDEGGAGNDFAEIYIRDEKNGNQRRPMSEASIRDGSVLGHCQGWSPWLGPYVRESCGKPNRLLTRSASNAYFSQTARVIAIPDKDELLRKAVNLVWEDYLQYCEAETDVRRERRKEKVQAALEGLSDNEVWAEVQRRLQGGSAVQKGIKELEIETLLSQKDSMGEDQPEGDFFARSQPLGTLPPEAEGKLGRLVLVHRLREVSAQLGFTRFEAQLPDISGELDLDVELAPLSRDPYWLPATQNRGEGIFLSVSHAALKAWLQRPAVQQRQAQLIAGFEVWRQRKRLDKLPFPGLPYLMLHSLSHLMITALALDCGYSASALSERIYAERAGHGILLYTGTPGSEGSLGGLVEMGRNIGQVLQRALELGRLCSNDPVCAHHNPGDPHEERFLHGAACHGCLLIAETSCEQRNEHLDRALVVPTVESPDAAFFWNPA